MGLTVTCTGCGQSYSFSTTLAGKRVRCRQCGAVFQIPYDAAAAASELDLSAFSDLSEGAESSSASKTAVQHSPLDASQSDDEGDPDFASLRQTSTWSEPAARAAMRFDFPYAYELDLYLPPVIVIGSVLWLVFATIGANTSDKSWISFVRITLLFAAFFLLVYPLTMLGTRAAARRMSYLLPSAPRWRVISCYFPAFTIATAMWQIGAGTPGSLFAGMVGGLLVGGAMHILLFRLRPDEMLKSVAIAATAFVCAVAIAGAILFTANYFVRDGVVKGNRLASVPVSPIGVGFDWPSPFDQIAVLPPARITHHPPPGPAIPEPSRPQPAPASAAPESQPIAQPTEPQTTSPQPTGTGETSPEQPATVAPAVPVPTPMPSETEPGTIPATSPGTFVTLRRQISISPDLDSVVFSATNGLFLAAIRAKDANGMIPVELWNAQNWTGQPAATFAPVNGVDDRFVISPDGRLLARLASFPHMAVQVWSFDEHRIVHTLPLDENVTQAQLLGFIDDRRLALVSDQSNSSLLELWNVANESEIGHAVTPPIVGACATARAISPDGRLLAIATGHLEQAGRVRSDPQIAGGKDIAGISILALDSMTPRNTKFPNWDSKYPVSPTGMAFSPEETHADGSRTAAGQRIALLFEQNGTSVITCYRTDGAYRPISEYSFPGSPVPDRNTSKPFIGSALTWMPDGKSWLLYGQRIIDAANGTPVATLPDAQDAIQQYVGPRGIRLVFQDNNNHKSVWFYRLNLQRLDGLLDHPHSR